MLEDRKQKEIEYYDSEAEQSSAEEIKEAGSKAGMDPFLLQSYGFLYGLLGSRCPGGVILDYGCGTGVHLANLAKIGREVIGIDLSQKSLEIAEKRLKNEKLEGGARVLLMDCEKMEFPDNSFDVVFDGGTFSSLDFDKALPQISRVLKPNGILIGIETLGHNPFTNLKRKINKITGKRTGWAAGHIFKMGDFKKAEKYFSKKDVYFFHLISWLAFPFMNLPGGKALLKLFEFIDKILLKMSFLRKYAFKVVFVFSGPKK